MSQYSYWFAAPLPPSFSFYNDDGDDQINHKSSRDAGGKIQKLRYLSIVRLPERKFGEMTAMHVMTT